MVIHNIDINTNRFPTFLPTAFLTTASPTLTLTLTIPPNPNHSPDCSHLLGRDAVVSNAVAEKGVTILIVYQKTSKTRFFKIFQNKIF